MERMFDLATNEINNFKDDIFEVGGERIAFAVDNEFAQEIVDYLNNKYGAVAKPTNEDSGLHLQRVNNLAKLAEFVKQQKDLPPEINDIVNDNFWDLI